MTEYLALQFFANWCFIRTDRADEDRGQDIYSIHYSLPYPKMPSLDLHSLPHPRL